MHSLLKSCFWKTMSTLTLSANLCKQFGHRSGLTKLSDLIWIQTQTLMVFLKQVLEIDYKKISKRQKAWKITQHAMHRPSKCKVNLKLNVGDWTCDILLMGLCHMLRCIGQSLSDMWLDWSWLKTSKVTIWEWWANPSINVKVCFGC